MVFSILLVAIGALILLAVTSMRFGADSRDEFPTKERQLAQLGLRWGDNPA